MALNSQIQLTNASNGDVFLIDDQNIVKVVADSLGSKVLFDNLGAINGEYIVSETPAQILAMSTLLISVTILGSSEGAMYINANRIIDIVDSPNSDNSTGTRVEYDKGLVGALRERLECTNTKAALSIAVAALSADTTYAIDAIQIGADEIDFAAGLGDLTAVFTAARVFSIIGSTGNDGTYTVDSSSFGGGFTTVVVDQDLTDATGDGTVVVYA